MNVDFGLVVATAVTATVAVVSLPWQVSMWVVLAAAAFVVTLVLKETDEW